MVGMPLLPPPHSGSAGGPHTPAPRWHGLLGSAGDILQDSAAASDPRLAATPSSSIALEIVGLLETGGAAGAGPERQGGWNQSKRSAAAPAAAAAVAAGGKAPSLSGRRRAAPSPHSYLLPLSGVMSVEGAGEGGGRWDEGVSRSWSWRPSTEADGSCEKHYR